MYVNKMANPEKINLSSMNQFSFSKNGSFYNVDRGADPDAYVKDISKLYDRTYANKFLDKM